MTQLTIFKPNVILEPILYKSIVNNRCDEQGRLEESIRQYCMNQIKEIMNYFMRFPRMEDILL